MHRVEKGDCQKCGDTLILYVLDSDTGQRMPYCQVCHLPATPKPLAKILPFKKADEK